MQDKRECGDSEEGFSPGGIIPGSPDDDHILVWIRPGEKFFTAEDLRRMQESGNPEWNEGEVP